MTVLRLLLVVGLLGGCGDDDGPAATPDAGGGDAGGTDAGEPDAGPADAGPPDSGPPDAGPLCDGPPGLYSDPMCTVISDDLRPFAPRYTLWSDAAGKERYVFLPAMGATSGQIDTTDPNHWVFPVGTRFYKTFLRDGVRIETRILEKMMEGTGPDVWSMRVFAWDEAQRTVTEVTDGVMNALGTTHDIPPQAFCMRCHQNGQPDVGLGFQALQLNWAAGEGPPDGVTLQDLIDEGRLTTPIDTAMAEVPTARASGVGSGEDPEVTRAALGYLHANCGHCHGGESPQRGLVMFVDLGLDYVEDTGTWTTGVDIPSSWTMGTAMTRIVPGSSMESTIWVRMGLRPDGQMPPIATEIVDPTGHGAVGAWIDALTR